MRDGILVAGAGLDQRPWGGLWLQLSNTPKSNWEIHVNKLLQCGVAAMFLGATATQVAMADTATTSGGLKIKTDDGKFEFGLGGRLQFDTVIFDDDKLADKGVFSSTSGSYFRRTYLTLTGKLYDFKFKFENDFTVAGPAQFREVWVSHEVLGGDLIVGQHKPFRGMEELTSSNELLVLERPFTTNVLFASGGNRQFQPGVFYKLPITTSFGYFLAQASAYNANHALGTAAGQGFGTSERLSYLAYSSDNAKLHFGAWGGVDNFSKTSPGAQGVNYAGRNSGTQVVGPSQLISTIGLGKDQVFYGAEVAGAYGPAFVQAEYARAEYTDARGPGLDDALNTWYVQGGYFLTGEKKQYKKDRGTFGSPKVNSPLGAVELVGRYDSVHNTSRSASAPSGTAAPGVCQAAAAVVVAGAECKVEQYTVGVNYYFNPAVRVMFNYVNGTNKVTDDNTSSYNVRLQLAF